MAGAILAVVPAMARAEPQPDARRILRRADAATRAVKAFSYTAECHGEGDLADRLPRVKGSLIGQHRPKSPLDKLFGGGNRIEDRHGYFKHYLRFRGKIFLPDSAAGKPFDIAIDSKRVVSIDRDRRLMTHSPFPAGEELIRPGSQLFMLEYLHPTPFSDEIHGRKATHLGVQTIGGVECDVIHVIYQNDSEARWYFGREDALPRRLDRIDTRPNVNGMTVLTITDLDIDPAFRVDTFHPSLPKGYEERPLVKRETPRLLLVGAQAPNWKLKSTDGKIVRLKDLRGQVVVMDFWATWCGFCKMSMKDVQALHDKFKDRPVRVLGINCWEEGDPAAYMKSKGYTYTTLLKGDKIAEVYGLSGLPTFYVIDHEGRIAYARTGLKREQELSRVVSKVLEKAHRRKTPTP